MRQRVNSSGPDNLSLRILSVSALFEGHFSIDWIIELTREKPSRVLRVLEEAVQRGHLSKKGHDEYRLADIQKKKQWTAYSEEEKRDWYDKIVALLIMEVPEHDRKIRVVADHMLHRVNDIDGCRWLMKSGDEQAARFRPDRAVQYYGKVIDDLGGDTSSEGHVIYMDAATKYAMASTGSENNDRVLAMLDSAMNRAVASKNRIYTALIKIHQARIQWLCARYTEALAVFDEGWAIAKEMEDPKLLHTVNTFVPYFFYWQGRFREAVQIYEKAVSNVEIIPEGTFARMAALTVGVCYVHTGQTTQGIGTIDAVRASLLDAENLYYTAFADSALGVALMNVHRLDDALRYFQDALKKAERYNNHIVRHMALIGISFAYYQKDEIKRSVSFLKRFLECRKEFVSFVHMGSYVLKIAWAVKVGKYPEVKGLSFEKEHRRMMEGGNVLTRGVALRFQAAMQRQRGEDNREILASLEASLSTLEESGHRIEYATTQLELARLYLAGMKDKERARRITIEASKALMPINDDLIPDDLKPLIQDVRLYKNPFEKILELSQQMVTIRNEKEVARKIVSVANHFTGAERGAIFLLDGADNRSAGLCLRASKNISEAQTLQPDFVESMQLAREVARSGKGQIFEAGPEADEMVRSGSTIRSRVCVPMILRSRVIGVLYNDNRLLHNVFKPYDLKILSFFAAQAALALDNATAYERIEHLNRKLKEEKLYYEEQHRQQNPADIIIGESAAIRGMVSQIDQVATSDTAVLILGETGVGKDLVARTIHQRSHRVKGPFISLQCSALPDTLISSELFGHEKGAYTGADKQRAGRFELADGGTLFLDEIGTLPMETQIRLLRVLQGKEFERIGGRKTVRSDFRLVTATNVDLEHEVKAGRFRADLFYRINVFPIHVPPLRERIEDIPLLADHFLKKYAEKRADSFRIRKINNRDMRRLMAYEWKGNVRELENVIERGVILGGNARFELPELAFPHDHRSRRKDGTSLAENERRHILWALQKTHWKVQGPGGAAEVLKINPSTLVSRIKKHGIRRPEAVKKRTKRP